MYVKIYHQVRKFQVDVCIHLDTVDENIASTPPGKGLILRIQLFSK